MQSATVNSIPRPEYPRPQFVRPMWLNLNGEWEFAFDDRDQGCTLGWQHGLTLDRRIVVSFPYQSELSGINDKSIHEIVWYARTFEIRPEWMGMNLLLQFGAVDYDCTVWVNGQQVGHATGGHTPFQFNIAPYVNSGENRLTLRVCDSQSPAQPRGKQAVSGMPEGIDYYCTTGIWQTVWIEPVPAMRIEELKITPRLSESTFEITVFLHAPFSQWRLEAEALYGGVSVARADVEVSAATIDVRLQIPDVKLWSPETPHLYELSLRLYREDELLDEVSSYSGMRDVRVSGGSLYLNNEPVYLRMVLDQGYWPQSYLAAPSDDALRADVEWIKRFGFNGARKHQKIEDPRWLYWCDRLGLLVWEEMPNAREWSMRAEESLSAEWKRAVERDINHPCIIAWVPVNESMGFPGLKESHPGQYAFLERIVLATRQIDACRPVIDNDGWEHSDITDICAIHDYTPTAHLLRERYHHTLDGGTLPAHVWVDNKPLFVLGSRYRGQPIILSEVGGFLETPDDLPAEKRDLLFNFYGSWETSEELLAKYSDLMEGIASLKFVSGFCYTQLTDIEQETNGLLTYDRKPKLDPVQLSAIHHRLFEGRQASADPPMLASKESER